MKESILHAIIKNERQRFVSYVRSLLRETATMEAEDIVHDVLVRLLEKADLIVPADNPVAYVYRSLKNRVIDYRKTSRAIPSLDSGIQEGERLMDMLRDIRPDALEIILSREGDEELFRALEVLTDIERKVIIAHEFEGTPYKDMVQMWDIPQNTLLSHKSRAMKKLKKYFLDSDGGIL